MRHRHFISVLSLALTAVFLTACGAPAAPINPAKSNAADTNSLSTPAASSSELAPTQVVLNYLRAQKHNDKEALSKTFGPGRGYDGPIGVKSLIIITVEDETNPLYMREILAGDTAKELGLKQENIAFVYALFDVHYDHELVPYDDGLKQEVFTLLRSDNVSPWQIRDHGHDRLAPQSSPDISSGASPFGTSTAGLSPAEVVTKYLAAKKSNDTKAQFDLLAAGYHYGSMAFPAVKSLDVVEVRYETNPVYFRMQLESGRATEATKERFAFVRAVYDIRYESTFSDDCFGRIDEVYTLIRADEGSPWLILRWDWA